MRTLVLALVLAVLSLSAHADDMTDCTKNRDEAAAMAACERVITDTTRAIEGNPKNAELFSRRGLAHFAKRDMKSAVADYGEAVRLSPGDLSPLVNRAVALFELDENAAAIKDMDAAIKLAPKLAQLYFYRGKMQLDSGNADRAVADFRQVLKLDPANAEAKALLADLGVEVK